MVNEDCVFTEAVDPSSEVPLSLPGLYSSVLINAAMGRRRGQPAIRCVSH